MSANDNIAAELHNGLNPSANDAVGGRLFEVREAYVEAYSNRLIGEFKQGPKREQKLNEFRREFDKQVKAQALKGSTNEDADPTPFKGEQEQKKREGFMGMVDRGLDMLSGILGPIGSAIWSFLKMLPGVQTVVSAIGSWFSDKTDTREDDVKAQEKRAAGMAAALGERFNVAGMTVSFPPEAQADLYQEWKNKDFKQAPGQKNTALYDISTLVPPNTVNSAVAPQQAEPVVDPNDPNRRPNVSADNNAADRANGQAAAGRD
jgi:hypothetical protein